MDSHSGNFLFRKIKKGGYYHYNIYGKDYYVENLGYVWEIQDFGFSHGFNNSEEINKKELILLKNHYLVLNIKIQKMLVIIFVIIFKLLIYILNILILEPVNL